MNNTGKRLILVMALCALMISLLPLTASANSAEPPSLVILTNNPPDDLSIVLVSKDTKSAASVEQVAWEKYYVFYSHDMKSDGEYWIKVTTSGESFECTIDNLSHYNNVYTLDLSNQKLYPGKALSRSVLLVSMRLLLTLFIEGLIFWLFGFRQKRSWLVFLVINLVTQGALNIWLDKSSMILQSYFIFNLIIGEFFVFAAEMITFPIFIQEHKKRRISLYAFIANLVSLIAGGYIIEHLPI